MISRKKEKKKFDIGCTTENWLSANTVSILFFSTEIHEAITAQVSPRVGISALIQASPAFP